MDKRIYNFSAGPAILPLPVLEKAREELLSLGGIGMSVMEISHRSEHFEPILKAAEDGIRELLNVPADYHILFLQGGASLQFSMVPMNLLPEGGTADYVVTGAWGKKAVVEAEKFGTANVVFNDEANGFKSVPRNGDLRFTRDAAYAHYTSNETIEGVEFDYELEAEGLPVVCDASSNILSKPIDISKNALIYAGAQKNIGPSGVTLVIVHDDMLGRIRPNLPSTLDYALFAKHHSMLNTPNTWGMYLVSLVCQWLREQGGVDAIHKRNREKAAVLYDAIDTSEGFYKGHADASARSLMNVTFRLPSEELDSRFCDEATANGLDGLKGHRTIGGIRASIYNAFPYDGVVALAELIKDFAARNG
jgi:phosphoserine aminotransferase